MPDYRLTKSVKEDLIGFAQCGDDHYGVEQSDRYRDQLKQRFSVLAHQPMLYSAVDHIRKGYRCACVVCIRSITGSKATLWKSLEF